MLLAAVVLAPPASLHAADAPAQKPNIVVILADDLGYGDVRCYNPDRGKIPTPNIDRLAAQGMRFTDAHSSSGVCSPSRYTLLTGRYHWRSRLQAGIVGVFGEPLIAPDRLTIAGLAKQHGYRTACIGKWHLGWDWPIPKEQRQLFQIGKGQDDEASPSEAHLAAWREVFSQPISGGPTTRGFDEYFGTDVPNWPPYCFIENNRTVGVPSVFLPRAVLQNHLASLPGPALKDWKLEPILPALGDHACEFITRQAQARQPFLLYLPLTTPHTPLAVNEPWRGKSGLDSAVADLIMETDATVGRVLNALETSGVAGDTLVLFTSDNGFAPYVGAAQLEARGHYPSGPLRGYKGDAWEGGHRVAVHRSLARRGQTRQRVRPTRAPGRPAGHAGGHPRHETARQRRRRQLQPPAAIARRGQTDPRTRRQLCHVRRPGLALRRLETHRRGLRQRRIQQEPAPH